MSSRLPVIIDTREALETAARALAKARGVAANKVSRPYITPESETTTTVLDDSVSAVVGISAGNAITTTATVTVNISKKQPTDKDLIKLLTELNNSAFTTEQLRLFKDNPHLQQLQLLGEPPRNDIPFRRILHDDDGAEPYTGFVKTIVARNKDKLTAEQLAYFGHYTPDGDFESKFPGGEFKTVLHWGQRKLLLSEIEFLTLFAEQPTTVGGQTTVKGKSPTVGESGAAGESFAFTTTVVYVGAAPGGHIPYLADLFPSVLFHLYDPVKFDIKPTDQIKIFKQLFETKDAEKYRGQKNVLLISDIRSVDFKAVGEAEYHAGILRDIQVQQSWYVTMRPHKAMLKFRFPYTQGQTEYLDGDVYFQAWSPVSSTETRLVPKGFADSSEGEGKVITKLWDHVRYEQQLYYYNNVTRVSQYAHAVQSKQLDHCYDCRCEIHILGQYLKAYGWPSNPADIDDMSAEINQFLSPSGARTLQTGNVSAEERAAGLAKKTNVDNKMAYLAAKDTQALELSSKQIEGHNWLSEAGDYQVTATKDAVVDQIKAVLAKVAKTKLRQVSDWYNLAVYAGEGPRQETYICYYYYTRDIAPSIGFIVDDVNVSLGKHKKTLYLLSAAIGASTTGDSISGTAITGLQYKTDIYIEEFPRQSEAILSLFDEILLSLQSS